MVDISVYFRNSYETRTSFFSSCVIPLEISKPFCFAIKFSIIKGQFGENCESSLFRKGSLIAIDRHSPYYTSQKTSGRYHIHKTSSFWDEESTTPDYGEGSWFIFVVRVGFIRTFVVVRFCLLGCNMVRNNRTAYSTRT